ncbi:type II secretion system protein M [Luminiphilus sp.]|nr:type II secretion system protein M [Luminiphilus sp.]MDA7840343.1 type II secretion system protein M [Luminiphilus sp.]MDA8827666.1 type II secretion system protein M [Luminiphilus sp.]MDA9579680.1 type II secretion system protein M [Luminiphilus sp.]MDB2352936.1 type II secretion system protein M [Luminiphilus sp.]
MMLQDWFNGRSRREQIYLLSMTLAVGAWLVVQMILLPASAARQQMALNNEVASQVLSRVDAKATRLMALRSATESSDRSSLTAAISRISNLEGLVVRRLQPNSRGEVQVRFEAVTYDALAKWLYRLEVTEGLLVIDASIVRSSGLGGVNATIRVADLG